ncbi:hypothetical protein AB0454_31315 [Streptomyces sp. NPDC093509]|uniref:hypothetical protein n=1 Tax=Streptomyces sp. NPDC093509 TaxID=3154982 RepID=UPI00344BB724
MRADRESLPDPHRVEPGRPRFDCGQSVQEPGRRQYVVRDLLVPAEGGDLQLGDCRQQFLRRGQDPAGAVLAEGGRKDSRI